MCTPSHALFFAFDWFFRQGSVQLRAVPVAAHFSDDSDITNVPLNVQFPHGLLVAMSDKKPSIITAGRICWAAKCGARSRRFSIRDMLM
jgi:hypothetical protein